MDATTLKPFAHITAKKSAIKFAERVVAQVKKRKKKEKEKKNKSDVFREIHNRMACRSCFMDSLTSENSLQVSYNLGTSETINCHVVMQRSGQWCYSQAPASDTRLADGKIFQCVQATENIVEFKHEKI
jgi:hypothetical protein